MQVGDRVLWTPHSWVREGEAPRVLVEIVKTRKAFGRTDYLIRPVSGEGETWAQDVTLTPLNGTLTDVRS